MINPQISRIGNQRWYNINDHWHRTDGPAVIYTSGYQSWYINNRKCFNNKSFQLAADLSDEDMLAMILKYGNVK